MDAIKKRQINIDVVICVIFALVILFEIFAYIFLNFFPRNSFIDEDFAKLARHTIEMGKQHTLFLQCWDYITTGELDCASILAIPFFMITKNIFVSFAIANIINILVWGYLIWKLMKCAHVPVSYRLIAISMVLALYDLGMLAYCNMMFFCGGQYVYKTMIPILLIYLLVISREKRWKTEMIVFWIFLLFLSFLTGISSGLYVLACGIIPITITTLIYSMNSRDRHDIIYRVIVLGTTIIAVILGLGLCGKLQVNPNTEKMMIASTTDYFDLLMNNFNNLIGVFNPFIKNDIKAISIDGIIVCIRWGIVGLIMAGWMLIPKAFSVSIHKKDKHISNENRLFLESMLISVVIWNFIVLFLTKSSPRYHLIGVIPLILSSVLVIEKTFSMMSKWIEISICIILALALQLLNMHTTFSLSKDYYNRLDYYWFDYNECDSLFDLFDDMRVETVIFIDSTKEPELLRALDTDRVYMTYFTAYSAISCFDYYTSARDRSTFSEKNALMVLAESYDLLPEYVKESYSKVSEFGSYMILYSESNPFDGICLVEKGLRTVDLPTTPGYSYDGLIDSKGYLHTTSVGTVMKSCNICSNNSFEFVINYDITEENSVSLIVYEKAAEDGVYDVMNLDPNEHKLSVNCIPGEYQFEIQNSNGENTVIREMEFICN